MTQNVILYLISSPGRLYRNRAIGLTLLLKTEGADQTEGLSLSWVWSTGELREGLNLTSNKLSGKALLLVQGWFCGSWFCCSGHVET